MTRSFLYSGIRGTGRDTVSRVSGVTASLPPAPSRCLPYTPLCRRPVRSPSGARSRGGAADGGADGGEGLVGVGAEGRDGGDADHDDQGQHHGVLDRRRAVLTLQKIHHALSKLTHDKVLSLFRDPWNRAGHRVPSFRGDRFSVACPLPLP